MKASIIKSQRCTRYQNAIHQLTRPARFKWN